MSLSSTPESCTLHVGVTTSTSCEPTAVLSSESREKEKEKSLMSSTSQTGSGTAGGASLNGNGVGVGVKRTHSPYAHPAVSQTTGTSAQQSPTPALQQRAASNNISPLPLSDATLVGPSNDRMHQRTDSGNLPNPGANVSTSSNSGTPRMPLGSTPTPPTGGIHIPVVPAGTITTPSVRVGGVGGANGLRSVSGGNSPMMGASPPQLGGRVSPLVLSAATNLSGAHHRDPAQEYSMTPPTPGQQHYHPHPHHHRPNSPSLTPTVGSPTVADGSQPMFPPAPASGGGTPRLMPSSINGPHNTNATSTAQSPMYPAPLQRHSSNQNLTPRHPSSSPNAKPTSPSHSWRVPATTGLPPPVLPPFSTSHASSPSYARDDDEDSVYSGVSSSNASSIRDDLPLCPDDEHCSLLNEKTHQRKFAHTCRLNPCYHGNVRYHSRLFRHAPGQVVVASDGSASGRSTPDGGSASRGTRQRRRTKRSLASVSYSNISPDAPDATKLTVACGDLAYEIFGDWPNVKVHTFKRYLQQVLGIPPGAQKLRANFIKEMDDDIAAVSEFDVGAGSTIAVLVNEDCLDRDVAVSSKVATILEAQRKGRQPGGSCTPPAASDATTTTTNGTNTTSSGLGSSLTAHATSSGTVVRSPRNDGGSVTSIASSGSSTSTHPLPTPASSVTGDTPPHPTATRVGRPSIDDL